MDSKKTVLSFIRPNLIPVIIFCLVPFIGWLFGVIILLCGTLPNFLRGGKLAAKLEARGEMEKAAAELTSANKKVYMKGKVVLTENFIFCKGTGFVFNYSDILWAYKHRQTNTFFLIPIKVTDSLYLAANGVKPSMVASMGKDKLEDIKNTIVEIYNHNNACLIGFTAETQAKYKELVRK